MTKAIVDTNILLRILIQDNELKAKKSVEFIRNATGNQIQLFVPMMVLLETVFVLERSYKLPKNQIKTYIEYILNTPQLKCENSDLMSDAMNIYVEKNIKLGDAIIASWAKDENIDTIYTYDEKDFKRIEGLNVKQP